MSAKDNTEILMMTVGVGALIMLKLQATVPAKDVDELGLDITSAILEMVYNPAAIEKVKKCKEIATSLADICREICQDYNITEEQIQKVLTV